MDATYIDMTTKGACIIRATTEQEHAIKRARHEVQLTGSTCSNQATSLATGFPPQAEH